MRRGRTVPMPKRALAMFIIMVALTGCQFAERGKRAALDAFASFALDSFYRMQSPLAEGTVQRASRSMTPASRGSVTPAPTIEPRAKVCRKTCPTKLPVGHATRVAILTPARTRHVRMIELAAFRPNGVDIESIKIETRFAALARCEALRDLARMRVEMLKSKPSEPRTVIVVSDTL